MTNEELKMTIGSNIKKYRKMKGFTQKELAKSVHIATPLIGALESQNLCQGISTYTLYKISKVLNVTVDKLFEKC